MADPARSHSTGCLRMQDGCDGSTRGGRKGSLVGAAANLLVGCSGTAPTASFPSATELPFSVQVADTLTKPSVEPGKVVVAVLLKGNRVPFVEVGPSTITQIAFEAHLVGDEPAGQTCQLTNPFETDLAKLLDPLHPDAVQPAL